MPGRVHAVFAAGIRVASDRYSGSLNSLYVGLAHYFGDSIGSGIGYNIDLMNIDSPGEDLRGSLKPRHHGPVVFARLCF